MKNLRELTIPQKAKDDKNSFELSRIWIASGELQISLLTGVWEDPASWGIALVDLMKHIANGYSLNQNENKTDILLRIKEGFDAEWSSPTDEPSGNIVD